MWNRYVREGFSLNKMEKLGSIMVITIWNSRYVCFVVVTILRCRRISAWLEAICALEGFVDVAEFLGT